MPKPTASGSRTRAASKAGAGKLPESAGAVRYRVLGIGLHLTEGQYVAIGNEHRIIAETFVSAGRPDEVAVNLASKERNLPVGPRQAQHRREIGTRLAPLPAPTLLDRIGHPLHGGREVARAIRPSGREDAGRTTQRVHFQTRIVGESRQ